MICFQISIFEPLKTASNSRIRYPYGLWFAFKLVSLNHWKQRNALYNLIGTVVICFQISIFEPLKTAANKTKGADTELWFAFKLVSLNHWKQHSRNRILWHLVVICFQISIFEPLKTATERSEVTRSVLWFAFKLVSLNHWKQPWPLSLKRPKRCDLLSN